MDKEKIPCATCSDICENAIRLYQLYYVFKDEPEVTMKRIGLQCHKTGLYYEIDLR